MSFDDYVAQFAVPHRAKDAFWHLVLSGPSALPAVRRGLVSDDHDVRVWSTRVLDHLVDEESWPELVGMLDDPDAEVRTWALHSLACERCKDNSCRADKHDVLPRAIRILQTDPDQHVRQHAVGLVACWMYDTDATDALVAAHASDPHPSVRKKAGWFVPGGSLYEKNKPKPARVTR